MTKIELRKIYLAKQKSLSLSERNRKSKQIADKLFDSFDFGKIRFLHCFLPIARTNEIDTNLIFKQIWKQFPHVKTLASRINFQKNEIENLELTAVTRLKQNQWQIDEPSGNEIVEAKEIDIVLVPLLCFDQRGFRVGYGKGFYDKLLKDCRTDCLKIGLSYFAPVARIMDVRKFDVQLDFCVTPEKIVSCK